MFWCGWIIFDYNNLQLAICKQQPCLENAFDVYAIFGGQGMNRAKAPSKSITRSPCSISV